MQILLKESVAKLGNRGDIVKVAPGYARNYLFPKKIAVSVTPGNQKQLEAEKRNYLKRLDEVKASCDEIKTALEEVRLEISKRAADNGQLFGSVTAHEVAKILAGKGLEIERRKLELPTIKEVGDYEAKVRLHAEVAATFSIKVIRVE